MARNPQNRSDLRAFISSKQGTPGKPFGRCMNIRYVAPLSFELNGNLIHPDAGPRSMFPFNMEYMHPTKGRRSRRVPVPRDQGVKAA